MMTFTGDLGGAVGGNDRFESVVVDVDQFGALYNFTESIAPSMVSKRLFLGNADGSLFAIPGTKRLTNYDLQDPVSAAVVYGDTNADGLGHCFRCTASPELTAASWWFRSN